MYSADVFMKPPVDTKREYGVEKCVLLLEQVVLSAVPLCFSFLLYLSKLSAFQCYVSRDFAALQNIALHSADTYYIHVELREYT